MLLPPMTQKSMNVYGIPPQEFLKQIKESHDRSPDSSLESHSALSNPPTTLSTAFSTNNKNNINNKTNFARTVLDIENQPEKKFNSRTTSTRLEESPSKRLCANSDKLKTPTGLSSPNLNGTFDLSSVAPFIRKLHDFVNDPASDNCIHWSHGGTRFEISDPDVFSNTLLPRYFKHKNLSSFIRQLNLYGFTKIQNLRQGVLISDVDSEILQFQHPKFQKHRPELLCEVNRKAESKSNNKQDVSHIVAELNEVKKNQTSLNEQLRELQHQNERLWKDNQEARIQNKTQRETINKILHFLGTLFSADKQPEKLQKRRLLLLDQPNDSELSSIPTSQGLSDPNAAFAKILQDYSLNHAGPTNDLQLGSFPFYNLPANQFEINDGNASLAPNSSDTDKPSDTSLSTSGANNNGTLIQSFDSGAGRSLDNIGQSLQTSQSNLGLINSNVDQIQNNLTTMESLLRDSNQTEALGSHPSSASDFLNQYITCGQEMIPFDYNNIFLDNHFLLQPPMEGADGGILTSTPVISGNPILSDPLKFGTSSISHPPIVDLQSSLPQYEEDIEEIVTEPPPMSTLSSMSATSPSFHDNIH